MITTMGLTNLKLVTSFWTNCIGSYKFSVYDLVQFNYRVDLECLPMCVHACPCVCVYALAHALLASSLLKQN